VILKSFAGAPPREVPVSEARLAAMLETNRAAFADEAALLRHLRRRRSVFMVLIGLGRVLQHPFLDARGRAPTATVRGSAIFRSLAPA
jgi:hypothetical protein